MGELCLCGNRQTHTHACMHANTQTHQYNHSALAQRWGRVNKGTSMRRGYYSRVSSRYRVCHGAVGEGGAGHPVRLHRLPRFLPHLREAAAALQEEQAEGARDWQQVGLAAGGYRTRLQ